MPTYSMMRFYADALHTSRGFVIFRKDQVGASGKHAVEEPGLIQIEDAARVILRDGFSDLRYAFWNGFFVDAASLPVKVNTLHAVMPEDIVHK